MLISSRATNLLLVAILAVGIAIVAMLAADVRGGPLDPPGAPGSTDGVRAPGTPISSLPFAITQPGRYYVTRNLSASGTAITITADDVVLDLGGFTIKGNGTGIGVDDGSALHTNVSVEHGVVREFLQGIFLANISYGHIRDVLVTGGNFGISTQQAGLLEDCEVIGVVGGAVTLAEKSIMRRCHIHDSPFALGVDAFAYSVIEDSIIELNNTGVSARGTRITIRNNRFMNNAAGGVSDVNVEQGTAVVVDNVINCTSSVQQNGGVAVTSDSSGGTNGHHNIPLFAANFCGAP